jgi:hypothetical protein
MGDDNSATPQPKEQIMTKTLTKRDLIEQGVDALDPEKLAIATVEHQPAHGVSQVNLPQVVEVAKFMSASGQGVPPHCRGNVGICLRLTFQAVEWQMSPFSVADMSFIVNDRIAYMSQLIHAVIEARAPLQHRLDVKYEGEGVDRTCTVIGHFTSGDTREYTTPKFKDIRTKNSPLWKDDPDQQFFYYASRSWARKWCPDVLLGVYTREELAEIQPFGGEGEAGSGLHARLSGAAKSEEGHSAKHAVEEINKIQGGGPVIDNDAVVVDEPTAGGKKGNAKKGKGEEAKAPARPDEAPPADQSPKNPTQYTAHAKAWIAASTDAAVMDKRWNDERAMRNNCGLTSDDREPIQDLLIDQREKLAKKE